MNFLNYFFKHLFCFRKRPPVVRQFTPKQHWSLQSKDLEGGVSYAPHNSLLKQTVFSKILLLFNFCPYKSNYNKFEKFQKQAKIFLFHELNFFVEPFFRKPLSDENRSIDSNQYNRMTKRKEVV